VTLPAAPPLPRCLGQLPCSRKRRAPLTRALVLRLRLLSCCSLRAQLLIENTATERAALRWLAPRYAWLTGQQVEQCWAVSCSAF
jgi:hypothetical protein